MYKDCSSSRHHHVFIQNFNHLHTLTPSKIIPRLVTIYKVSSTILYLMITVTMFNSVVRKFHDKATTVGVEKDTRSMPTVGISTSSTKHAEPHSKMGDFMRDAILGFADGLTVPFALTAGLSAYVYPTLGNIIKDLTSLLALARYVSSLSAVLQNSSPAQFQWASELGWP